MVSLCVVLVGVLALACSSALAFRGHVFCESCSFGSTGSGEGQFSAPAGVAVSEVGGGSGDVYVVDRGNNRVEVFDPAGAYVSQFDGSAAPTGVFSSPEAIAVDNSANPFDPSAGDVYVTDTGHSVVDKFSAAGTYLGQIAAGAGGQTLGGLYGVAVDPQGVVWVYQESGEVDSYSDALGSPLLASAPLLLPNVPDPGFAVDGEDDLYAVFRGRRTVEKFDGRGNVLREEIGGSEEAAGLAVDTSSNDLFIAATTSVGVFTPAGASIESFGAGHLSESGGIAVSASSGSVYVSDRAADAVEVFREVVLPDVLTGEASNLQGEGSATLNGTVDPAGAPVSSCAFEYGPSSAYGSSAECASDPGSGTGPVAVSANLSGLTPGAAYHYRLVAENANGSVPGKDQVLFVPGKPTVAGEALSEVSSSGATVGALVNPDGLPTTYTVEYGASTAYGSSTPEASAGAGHEAVGVRVQLSALPQTVYHARLVATNDLGTTAGGDLVFTTPAAPGPPSTGLPDGRVAEVVSPAAAEGHASVYVRSAGQEYLTTNGEHGIYTGRPFDVSPDGGAVVYPGDPPLAGGGGHAGDGAGDEYLARRSAGGGWTQLDLQPANVFEARYLGFSSDLSAGIIFSGQPPRAGEPGQGLYSHATSGGDYTPLAPTKLGSGEDMEEEGYLGANAGTSSVSGASHLLFRAKGALLEGEGQLEAELREDVKSRREAGGEVGVLYDSLAGRPSLVSVLPSGRPEVDASFGGDPTRVVSADGWRVFWSDLNTDVTAENPAGVTRLFVRENDSSPDAKTVQVDAAVAGGGVFWGASADGSKAFFIKGDLYEYDLASGQTTDLAPGVEVQGLAGISEDGEYVYYVDAGNRLNVWHDGASTFVAALSAADDSELVPYDGNGEGHESGDWQTLLRNRTAEVTPDGRHLLFMASESLTGYDNQHNGQAMTEVYLYDAGSAQLTCVSCNPSGEAPVTTRFDSYSGPVGGFFPISRNGPMGASRTPRVISADGSRVFFDSGEPLVPQDTNGWLGVYEWERDGTGSCRQVGGCVYLLSDGRNPDSSYLLGASASGDDVFVITRAQLVAQDRNENEDVYDMRVGGVHPPPPAPVCSGSACQGAPPAPPLFATFASATLSGAGNLQAPAVAKAPAKPKLKAKKRHAKKRKKKSSKGRKSSRARQGRKASANGKGRR